MLAPASLTLAGLKLHLDKELGTDDDFLELLLEAAFLQAQAAPPNGCGRVLAPDPALVAAAEPEDPPVDTADPVTRRIRVRRDRLRVLVPDAREITTVTADDVAVTDWEVGLERDGLIVQIELAETCKWCEITGRFGFLTIPVNLATGIYVLAARAHAERDARYADQVVVAEGASASAYYRQLPPATKLAFASYTLPAGLGGLS